MESRKSTTCGPGSINHVGGKDLVEEKSLLQPPAPGWGVGMQEDVSSHPGEEKKLDALVMSHAG